MWWRVLCKVCKSDFVVRVNPDYNLEFTCVKYECDGKLVMVEELSAETVNREFSKPYDHGKSNNTVN